MEGYRIFYRYRRNCSLNGYTDPHTDAIPHAAFTAHIDRYPHPHAHKYAHGDALTNALADGHQHLDTDDDPGPLTIFNIDAV